MPQPKIFGGSRQNGKTTRLLKHFLADPTGVLFVDHSQVAYIKQRVPSDRHADIVTNPYTLRTVDPNRRLYIDELGYLLETLLGRKVGAVSILGSGPKSSVHDDATPKQYSFSSYIQEFPVEYWNATN